MRETRVTEARPRVGKARASAAQCDAGILSALSSASTAMSPPIIPPPVPSIPVAGTDARFPVRRIYCIGRNYAAHAKEMGMQADRTEPMFFMKPADAIVTGDADAPYPSATHNLHHEVEMIVALARGGRDIPLADALGCVYAYGVGLDLTRRDLQAAAIAKGNPWDTAKGFDASAPVSALRRVTEIGHPEQARLVLEVNGQIRQDGNIADMIFNVAEIIHHLSRLWILAPGDLIFSGTPSGVGALQHGDRLRAELAGVGTLHTRIV
jgi:fumarylpyruvate hydrolase